MNRVRSIDEYNAYFHQKTSHPLVAVAELSRADLRLFEPTDFGMYCVVLMDSVFGDLHKDRERIGYQAGTLFSLRPGQTVFMDLDYTVRPRGWMLAFRPELLEKTGLGRDFYMFSFFSDDADEALRLDGTERGIILNCFANICAELDTPPDYLSDQLVRLGIGQLLSYFKRFHERQFSKASSQGNSIVQRLDTLVDNYLSSGQSAQKGHPTVAWCAEQFNLSPNYFGDLLKKELHMTAQDYLQEKMTAAARHLLRDTNLSISEIAEELGFSYANHFSRMFVKRTGMSPLRFRKSGL